MLDEGEDSEMNLKRLLFGKRLIVLILTLITSLGRLLLSFGLTIRPDTMTFPLVEIVVVRGSIQMMLTAHTLVPQQGIRMTPFTWRSITYPGESMSTF